MKIVNEKTREINKIAWMKSLLDFDYEDFKARQFDLVDLSNLEFLDLAAVKSKLKKKKNKFSYPKIDYLIISPHSIEIQIFVLFPLIYFSNEIFLTEPKEKIIKDFFDRFTDQKVIDRFVDFRNTENVFEMVLMSDENFLINPYAFSHPKFKKKISKILSKQSKYDFLKFKNYVLSDKSFLEIVSPEDCEFYQNLFDEIEIIRGL
ncbi:MAG: hypothetical protein QXW35_04405 [Candidatus Aenigmatarchaeota archaeon]